MLRAFADASTHIFIAVVIPVKKLQMLKIALIGQLV